MRNRRLIGGLALAALLSVLVYAVLAALTDAEAVAETLRDFPISTLVAMLLLALLCYLLRALRWRGYAGRLGHPASLGDAVYVHFSSMTMTVTPGKVGEVLKAYLAREIVGMPMARGVTLLFVERLIDLIAVLVLSLGGLSLFLKGTFWFPGMLALVFAGTLVLSSGWFHSRALKFVTTRPWMQRHKASATAVSETLRSSLALGPLLGWTGVSVIAWGAEGLAFWLCLRALDFTQLGVASAVAVYALSTVIGALLFLPGGIGVTEASLAGLLIAAGASGDVATAATVLIRLVTLWFAVGLGWLVFFTRPKMARAFLSDASANGNPTTGATSD